jgi:PPK2 family polyphosphate:nucleotide phosphotransferase
MDSKLTGKKSELSEQTATIVAPQKKSGSRATVTFRGDEADSSEGVLSQLLQEQVLEEADYREKLKSSQADLLHLQRGLAESKRSLIVVFEGPDAAGKGGTIKRVVEKLDPRTVRVYSVVKPTAEEYRHHYMWRFWHKLPATGEIAIFDRSWYGRVLVERVEGFAKSDEWKRAYREINDFEHALVDDGAIFVKLFLQITKDEQLSRFKKREADPLKHWKISDEDWRNRNKWDQHIRAAEEMFRVTSTKYAPWHAIAANSKWFTRLSAIRLIVRALQKAGITP